MIIETEINLKSIKCDYCNENATFIKRKVINLFFIYIDKSKAYCDNHRTLEVKK